MKKNRVYTLVLQQTVLPGALGGTAFQINNENRTALLKSIALDINIREFGAPFRIMPLEQNVNQEFLLEIQALPVGSLFAQIFQDIVNPIVIANGDFIQIYKPQQLKFESFFIRNNLLFNFTYTNRDVLVSWMYSASIIVELEDIESV